MDGEAFRTWLSDRIREEGTETAVAKKAGLSQSVIHRWASGEHTPSIDKMIACLKAYGYDLQAVSSTSKKGDPDKRLVEAVLKNVLRAMNDLREQVRFLVDHLPEDDPNRAMILQELQSPYGQENPKTPSNPEPSAPGPETQQPNP